MSAASTARLLHTVGIVALVPSELPDLYEVADALLASPVLAVEVIPNGPSLTHTVRSLRRRGGDEWLVGVGRVEDEAALQAAIDAGAHFASSAAEFRLPLLAYARRRDFLYVPTVHAPGQALISQRAGCTWQKIRDDIDFEGLEGLQERTGSGVNYIVNQVSLEFVTECVEAGAKLLCVNDIYTHPAQPMADLITRARTARSAWLEATTASPPESAAL